MENRTVVIVGGSSGMGLRVAERVVELGGQVVLGARSRERLEAAVDRLGPRARGVSIDTSDKESIAAFFEQIPSLDHLFTPGSSHLGAGPIDTISDEVAESPFRSKFWGQYWSVKHARPRMAPGGSIVLMGGAYGAHPPRAAAAYAACNSAVESLGRALAVELAPLRVNVVSPGLIDSALWQRRPEPQRTQAYSAYAEASLLGRVGTVDEVAGAVLFLMQNTYTTGSVLYPDGGYVLR
ncbi:SDR family oxidoreductase [Pendulispora albinea]|uniref:SDR family oxidoreductase n=1 Tax=Pendulispora albinea TaxID=2741071 RepID=A0ABZ2LM78_9BACT